MSETTNSLDGDSYEICQPGFGGMLLNMLYLDGQAISVSGNVYVNDISVIDESVTVYENCVIQPEGAYSISGNLYVDDCSIAGPGTLHIAGAVVKIQ